MSGTAQGKRGLLVVPAAAPTFAIMALVTWIHGGGMPDMVCSAAGNGFPTERHGPDVFANERLPFAALAKARLQSVKRRPLDLGGIDE